MSLSSLLITSNGCTIDSNNSFFSLLCENSFVHSETHIHTYSTYRVIKTYSPDFIFLDLHLLQDIQVCCLSTTLAYSLNSSNFLVAVLTWARDPLISVPFSVGTTLCCPVMIMVLVCLSHRHRPSTATYHRHTYYSGTPPWTIEICPTILRLTQGRTFSPMVSHTCQPVKCPVPWGHLSLLSCTTLLGWGLNVSGYQ